MAVLDEETKSDNIGDEHMRRITGIHKSEEDAMEERAREGLDSGGGSMSPEALENAEQQGGESAAATEGSSDTEAPETTEAEALTQHENQIGEGMRNEKPSVLRRWGMRAAGMSGRKKALAGGGLFGILITMIFMAFLAFLPMKINHIVENLTSHFFASSQDAVGRRVNILMSDYMKRYVLRGMTGVDGACHSTKTITRHCVNITGSDSLGKKLFTAWHDAGIENDLANKYGFEIAYKLNGFDGPDGKVSYRITIDGNKFPLSDEFASATGSGNILEVAGTRNDVTRVAKEAAANETLWKRVMYRFKVSRLLERKFDARWCLFICKKSNTFKDWKDAKTGQVKKNVARAILSARVVNKELSGMQLILACMVSSDCGTRSTSGEDFNRNDKFDTELQSAMKEIDSKLEKYTASDILKELDKFQEKGFLRYVLDTIINKTIKSETASSFSSSISEAIPILGQIDTVAQWIQKFQGVTDHLKQWIFAAKAAALVSTFVIYRSYADEVKDGKVDPQLLGEMVKSLGSTAGGVDDGVNHQGQPAESTPLYSELMGSKPATTASILNIFSPTAYAQATQVTTIQKTQYVCQDGHSVPKGQTVCNEDRVDSNGLIGDILDALKGPPFDVITQAADVWNHNPIIEGVHWAESLAGDAVSLIVNNVPGMDKITSLLGGVVSSVMGDFLKFVQEKILPSPLTDNPSGGSTFDAMAGGADIAGNDYAQYGTGGGRISDQTAADIRTQQENDARNTFASKPFFARMFDKESPYSLVSQIAMTMPLNAGVFSQNTFASLISEPFTKLAQAFSSLFTTRLSYAASAAPDPFGVPQVGYNPNDPALNMDPDIFTDAYCKQMNEDWVNNDIIIDNYQTGAYHKQALPDSGDPNTGTDVHSTTNPCLLEAAATGSGGGLFSDSVLDKKDLTDPGSSNGGTTTSTGGLVQGDIKSVAQQILNSPNVEFEASSLGNEARQEVQTLANGGTIDACGKGADLSLFEIIATLLQTHKLRINNMIRAGDSCAQSPHANGCAADIGYFDGQEMNGDNATSISFINTVLQITSSSQRLGFGVGNGYNNDTNTIVNPALNSLQISGRPVTLFGDNPNHVHMDTRCHV